MESAPFKLTGRIIDTAFVTFQQFTLSEPTTYYSAYFQKILHLSGKDFQGQQFQRKKTFSQASAVHLTYKPDYHDSNHLDLNKTFRSSTDLSLGVSRGIGVLEDGSHTSTH